MTRSDGSTGILLVRHGETAWNRDAIFRGRHDVPLNATGREQARTVGSALAGRRIDVTYSSPLSRSLETARIACVSHRVEIRTHEGFLDFDYGDWTGKREIEVQEHWPMELETWTSKPSLAHPPRGETLQMVFDRCFTALEEVALCHRGEVIAIFAHRVVNKVLILGALQLGLDRFPYIVQGNCCINEIERLEDAYRIHVMNDTAHIRSAGLPLLKKDF